MHNPRYQKILKTKIALQTLRCGNRTGYPFLLRNFGNVEAHEIIGQKRKFRFLCDRHLLILTPTLRSFSDLLQ